eukprot:TRINITY_DN25539_c0_g1_i1.p1 TRINITY_DN25539_c0_g1~~TRINITY_DN25539_c0_g1_i1.p1  ORF type:complete len:462 (+),score=102.03 TRINITY_DN25539_c0_g1_i1:88-1386(+)
MGACWCQPSCAPCLPSIEPSAAEVRVALLGPRRVGKSALVDRLLYNHLPELAAQPTPGVRVRQMPIVNAGVQGRVRTLMQPLDRPPPATPRRQQRAAGTPLSGPAHHHTRVPGLNLPQPPPTPQVQQQPEELVHSFTTSHIPEGTLQLIDCSGDSHYNGLLDIILAGVHCVLICLPETGAEGAEARFTQLARKHCGERVPVVVCQLAADPRARSASQVLHQAPSVGCLTPSAVSAFSPVRPGSSKALREQERRQQKLAANSVLSMHPHIARLARRQSVSSSQLHTCCSSLASCPSSLGGPAAAAPGPAQHPAAPPRVQPPRAPPPPITVPNSALSAQAPSSALRRSMMHADPFTGEGVHNLFDHCIWIGHRYAVATSGRSRGAAPSCQPTALEVLLSGSLGDGSSGSGSGSHAGIQPAQNGGAAAARGQDRQ